MKSKTLAGAIVAISAVPLAVRATCVRDNGAGTGNKKH